MTTPPPPTPVPDQDLLDAVYAQLRAVAQQRMNAERRDHTLTATALVHEAYLKLADGRRKEWANEAHFYVAASEAMRQILIDHARGRGRQKRGGAQSRRRLELSQVADLAKLGDPESVLAFDRAFCRLEEEAPQAAAVVRLRFFAGLSVDQAADALGVSSRTIDRQWAFARAWLFRALDSDTEE